MQKWEHLFILVDNAFHRFGKVEMVNGVTPNTKLSAQDYFKQLGEEGWELVSAPTYAELVFKRPID